ncbi:MAG: SDR family NAD(P)-dependent oxidoreductase [Chlorobi bacterium]|nr:SDR family NAD(P)-dependent oxidoreductase [Chlorobiota bacterium]
MRQFSDRIVVVGGAAGNVGRAVSAAFYEAGASLALCDRHAGPLHQTYDGSERVLVLETDLASPESAGLLVADVLRVFGRIDAFVALTGGFSMGTPLHLISSQDWEYMMRLNVSTLSNVCHAVIPHMRERGQGKIVTVGARSALSGKALMGPYCASKATVIRFTETLSEENKHYGINVNCVLPSIVDTPQNRKDMPDSDFSTWVDPDALADVIVFLASDASRALHGAAVPVYGRC